MSQAAARAGRSGREDPGQAGNVRAAARSATPLLEPVRRVTRPALARARCPAAGRCAARMQDPHLGGRGRLTGWVWSVIWSMPGPRTWRPRLLAFGDPARQLRLDRAA